MPRSLKKTFLIFTLCNILGLILSTISSLWAARLLGPNVMGMYNAFNLLIVYSPLLAPGIYNGLNLGIPLFIGRGEMNRVSLLVDTAHYMTKIVSMISFVVLLIIGVLYAVIIKNNDISLGYIVFAAVIPVTFYKTFVEVTCRTSGDFYKLSFVRISVGVLGLITVPLIYITPWGGMLARTVILALVGLVLIWYGRKIPSIARFEITEFKYLMKTGIPIFIVGYIYVFMNNLDRTLIVKMLGVDVLGYYTPSLLLLQGMAVIPMSVNQIIYPRMAELYGRTGSVRSLSALAFKPIPLLTIIQLPFVVLGWVYLPDVLNSLLPQYGKAVDACRLAMVSGFILTLNSPGNIFNILRKQMQYSIILVISCVIMAIASIYNVKHNFGLVGIVYATIISNTFFVITIALVAWHYISKDRRMHVI